MAGEKLAGSCTEEVDEADGCGGGVLMALHLRLALFQDIPTMHAIRTSVTENILSEGSTFGPDNYLQFLGASGETWLGEIDGRMAGFGAIDRNNSSVWALFVSPEFESLGVGKALLHHLITRAQQLEMTAFHLTTTPGTRAEQFYLRQGWQFVGAAPNGEVSLQYLFNAPKK
jgi:GNAT superfamily N-acetyltransferase